MKSEQGKRTPNFTQQDKVEKGCRHSVSPLWGERNVLDLSFIQIIFMKKDQMDFSQNICFLLKKKKSFTSFFLFQIYRFVNNSKNKTKQTLIWISQLRYMLVYG